GQKRIDQNLGRARLDAKCGMAVPCQFHRNYLLGNLALCWKCTDSCIAKAFCSGRLGCAKNHAFLSLWLVFRGHFLVHTQWHFPAGPTARRYSGGFQFPSASKSAVESSPGMKRFPLPGSLSSTV